MDVSQLCRLLTPPQATDSLYYSIQFNGHCHEAASQSQKGRILEISMKFVRKYCIYCINQNNQIVYVEQALGDGGMEKPQ